ncbi:ATP-grasp domain-containing protein [Methylophilus flavus]|uniref:ATP-grasp domain-containing protein n=1 Tax=Methylophilus flavus TaxID=640084 RepID=A0ABW3P7N0_9PROT
MQNKSRLKIWVCEYVSAGGLASADLPASLLQEGLLMRDALLHDLSQLAVDCITSHDARVMAPESAVSTKIEPHEDVFAVWRKQLASEDIDACWVIAPETDGILERMCQMVRETGKRWIGCSEEAIRQTSSKSLMADICFQAGIATIAYRYLHAAMSLPSQLKELSLAGWVVKPDDGAGCEFTYHFKSDIELIEFNHKIKINPVVPYTKLLLQPYLPGLPLSMSVIATNQQVKVIAGHEQWVKVADGQFHFRGAGVNQAAQYLPLMQAMAEKIQHAIPGLTGYWGADLILTEDNILTLVEINPRLTTSYTGLSKVLSENPARLVLDAVLNNRLTLLEAASSVSLALPSAGSAVTESLSL